VAADAADAAPTPAIRRRISAACATWGMSQPSVSRSGSPKTGSAARRQNATITAESPSLRTTPAR
jgi:hypothetical protein